MLIEFWGKFLHYLYFPDDLILYLDVGVRLLFSMYYLPVWAFVFALLHSVLESIVYTLIVPAALEVQRGVQNTGKSYLEAAAAAMIAGSNLFENTTAADGIGGGSASANATQQQQRLLYGSQVLDSLVPSFFVPLLRSFGDDLPMPLRVALESLVVIFTLIPYGALAIASCAIGHKLMTVIVEAMVDAFSRLEDGKDYPLVAARLRFVCKNPRRFWVFSLICIAMYGASFVAMTTKAFIEYANRPLDVVLVSGAMIAGAMGFMVVTAIYQAPSGLQLLAHKPSYIALKIVNKVRRRGQSGANAGIAKRNAGTKGGNNRTTTTTATSIVAKDSCRQLHSRRKCAEIQYDKNKLFSSPETDVDEGNSTTPLSPTSTTLTPGIMLEATTKSVGSHGVTSSTAGSNTNTPSASPPSASPSPSLMSAGVGGINNGSVCSNNPLMLHSPPKDSGSAGSPYNYSYRRTDTADDTVAGDSPNDNSHHEGINTTLVGSITSSQNTNVALVSSSYAPVAHGVDDGTLSDDTDGYYREGRRRFYISGGAIIKGHSVGGPTVDGRSNNTSFSSPPTGGTDSEPQSSQPSPKHGPADHEGFGSGATASATATKSSSSKRSSNALARQEVRLRSMDKYLPCPSPEVISYITGQWWETSIHRVRHMAIELLIVYFVVSAAFGNGPIATAPKAVEIMIYLNFPHLLGFLALAVTESIIRRMHSILWLMRHPRRIPSILLVASPYLILLIYCTSYFYPAPLPTATLLFATLHQAFRAVDLARWYEVSPQGGVQWVEIRPAMPSPSVIAAAMQILSNTTSGARQRPLFVPPRQQSSALLSATSVDDGGSATPLLSSGTLNGAHGADSIFNSTTTGYVSSAAVGGGNGSVRPNLSSLTNFGARNSHTNNSSKTPRIPLSAKAPSQVSSEDAMLVATIESARGKDVVHDDDLVKRTVNTVGGGVRPDTPLNGAGASLDNEEDVGLNSGSVRQNSIDRLPREPELALEIPVSDTHAIMLEDARQRGKSDLGIVGLDTAADIGLMRLYRRGQTLPSRLERRVVPKNHGIRNSFLAFATPRSILLLSAGSFSGARFSNVRRVQKYVTWTLLSVFVLMLAILAVQSVIPSLQPSPMGVAVDTATYTKASFDHLVIRLTFKGKGDAATTEGDTLTIDGKDGGSDTAPTAGDTTPLTPPKTEKQIRVANLRAAKHMELPNDVLVAESPFAGNNHTFGVFPPDAEDEYPGLCRATFGNDVSVFELSLLAFIPYLGTSNDVEAALGFFNRNMDTQWTLATSLWANGTFAARPADCWASDPNPPLEMVKLCEEAKRARARDWSGFFEFHDAKRDVRVIAVRGTDPTAVIDMLQDVNMFFEAVLYQILAAVVPGAGILPASFVSDFIRVASMTDVLSQRSLWDPHASAQPTAPESNEEAPSQTSSLLKEGLSGIFGDDLSRLSDSLIRRLFHKKTGNAEGMESVVASDDENLAAVEGEDGAGKNASKSPDVITDDEKRRAREQIERIKSMVATKASSMPQVLTATELSRVTSDRDYHLRVLRYVQSRMEMMVTEEEEAAEAAKGEDSEGSSTETPITPTKKPGHFPPSIRDKVIMTGHSMGGAIAHIVGTRLKLRSVAFSSPGIVLSHKKFGITDLKSVHSRTFTVASTNDIVPMIGWIGGEVHNVECAAKSSASEKCHVMEFMIGALWHNCATIRRRYPKLLDVL